MRFERKFQVEDITNEEIDIFVKTHPALFFEEYAPRFVNNIYLDTQNLDNYNDSITGSCNRVKVRIRWYGQGWGRLGNPILELKIKQGQVGHKVSFPLHEFVLDESLAKEQTSEVFGQSDLPPHVHVFLKSLKPALINRYLRKYYVSADRRFRLTIDSKLEYFPIDVPAAALRRRRADPHLTVIEIKYEQDLDIDPSTITSHFPFRMTRCSKYVHGMEKFAA